MLALCIPFMDDAAGKYRPQLAQLLRRLSFMPPKEQPDRLYVGLLERPGVAAQATVDAVEALLSRRGRSPVEVEWVVAPASSWRPSVSRNLAARQAIDDGARELVFMDADCLPNAGAFPELRQELRRRSALVLNKFWCVSDDVGAALAVSHGGWDRVPDPPDCFTADGRVIYAPGLILGVRAKDFADVGGYDEMLQPGEDEDLIDRLRRHGCKLALYNRLAVHCGVPADYVGHPLYDRARAIIDTRAAQHVTRIEQRWGSGSVQEIAA